MSLYLALRARLVQHSDDVLVGLSCVVLCAAVCCEQSSPVMSAGADTAAGRLQSGQGAGCRDTWLPQLTTHSWLADPAHCCRHRTFAPRSPAPPRKQLSRTSALARVSYRGHVSGEGADVEYRAST